MKSRHVLMLTKLWQDFPLPITHLLPLLEHIWLILTKYFHLSHITIYFISLLYLLTFLTTPLNFPSHHNYVFLVCFSNLHITSFNILPLSFYTCYAFLTLFPALSLSPPLNTTTTWSPQSCPPALPSKITRGAHLLISSRRPIEFLGHDSRP